MLEDFAGPGWLTKFKNEFPDDIECVADCPEKRSHNRTFHFAYDELLAAQQFSDLDFDILY